MPMMVTYEVLSESMVCTSYQIPNPSHNGFGDEEIW